MEDGTHAVAAESGVVLVSVESLDVVVEDGLEVLAVVVGDAATETETETDVDENLEVEAMNFDWTWTDRDCDLMSERAVLVCGHGNWFFVTVRAKEFQAVPT